MSRNDRSSSINRAKGLDSLAVIMIGVRPFRQLTSTDYQHSYFMGANRAKRLLAVGGFSVKPGAKVKSLTGLAIGVGGTGRTVPHTQFFVVKIIVKVGEERIFEFTDLGAEGGLNSTDISRRQRTSSNLL